MVGASVAAWVLASASVLELLLVAESLEAGVSILPQRTGAQPPLELDSLLVVRGGSHLLVAAGGPYSDVALPQV